MSKLFAKFRKNKDGVASIEFALIGSLAVVFALIVLEFTLVLHYYLRIDEAIRQATREAVIAPAIVDLQPLSNSAIECNRDGANLACSGAAIVASSSYDRILATAQAVLPSIEASMLDVSYSSSGVGNAATAGGTQPLVTVSINGYQYDTIILSIIGISTIDFPDNALSRIKAV